MYRGRGSHRTVFKHQTVAKQSQRYAKTIAAERGRILDRKVSVRENIYTGRAPLEPGNLGLVQLLTDVPRVSNQGVKSVRTCLVNKVEPVKGQFTRPKKYLPYGL